MLCQAARFRRRLCRRSARHGKGAAFPVPGVEHLAGHVDDALIDGRHVQGLDIEVFVQFDLDEHPAFGFDEADMFA